MVAEGYKDTEIGVIPIEWEIGTLNEEFSPKQGTYLEANLRKDGAYRVYGANGIIGKYSKFMYEDRTILISCRGEYCGVVHLTKEQSWVSNNSIALSEPSEKINPIYFYYHFSSDRFIKEITGSAQPQIVVSSILNKKIPLPPLKEQEKIADILSTADEKIDAIQIQIDRAETLKKGLLQKLLSEGIEHSEFKDSELGKIPESWEVKNLGDIADIKGGKRLPKGYSLSDTPTPFPYIRVTNMSMGGINDKQMLYVPIDIQHKIKNYIISKDDLYIAVAGNTLGMVGDIPDYLDNANLTENADKICNIQIHKGYLLYVLLSNLIQKEIENTLTTTAQPKLALTRIKTFKIPIPPLEEQEKIADILSTAYKKSEVLGAKKEKYETLKKGLLQKLLSGEVRV